MAAKIADNKVFSKEKWLQSANEDKARGILSQAEIEDACAIWVDAADGKTYAELNAKGNKITREEWFV